MSDKTLVQERDFAPHLMTRNNLVFPLRYCPSQQLESGYESGRMEIALVAHDMAQDRAEYGSGAGLEDGRD